MDSFQKIVLKITFIFTTIILFVSCDRINEKILPSITGKSGDLLVVVDSFYFNHQTGEAIKQTFTQEQKGLPQREALFNLIKVPHRSFARIFQTNRNIIIINIKPNKKTKISINKNVWAKMQLVVNITAPNDKIAAETILKNGKTLINYFNDKEIERLQSKYALNANSNRAKFLEKKLGLKINIDDLFFVASEDSNFVWLRKEYNVGKNPVSQGIILYTYPYNSDSVFNVLNLVAKRNEITKKYIKGGAENSYMTVYSEYTPDEKEINLKGIYVKELRGLWQMEGDFMGGPFISYSMVDEAKKRVITIDAYVYAPQFNKREYLRELEALALTINF